ncbi:MAG TPA: hypothetical protein VFU78_08350, partial [Thermomicrobiales bacterium]|nr:hypothetical protein [Thermomicrobiales bacterium]
LAHGGLAINGYPITNEQTEKLEDGKDYLVQWFERVRMEYHPESANPQYQVLLGQFGRILHPADPPVAAQPGQRFFMETGHNVPPDFATYWDANGGLAQFGYPLSEVIKETLEDGKSYDVQYFERARFERHPENRPPYNVLLGQFGRKILDQKTAPPPPPVSKVIFQDDFSNPNSGWIGGSYEQGGYRMTADMANASSVALHPKLRNLTDTKIEVDARKLGGPDDSTGVVIMARVRDFNNFYLFIVTSNGAAGIVKMTGGTGTVLAMGQNAAIHQGNATNHLQVDCVGKTLTLFVNGQKVLEIQDGDLASGDLMLGVNAGSKPGGDILFDNFVARLP